jgi:glycosyltransferase involved in cell wall biosynthesis
VQAVGWYFPDSLGGTEVYVGALSHELRRQGHQVVVAAPDATGARERRYEHDGGAVYRYPIPSSPTRAEARGLTRVRGAELFHRWLAAERPDVVHFHTFVTGLGLPEVVAAKAIGARVIVTTHSAGLGFLCERGTMLRDGRTLCDARVTADTCARCALGARGVPRPIARAMVNVGGAVPRVMPRLGRLGTALELTRLVQERRAAQERLLALVDAFVVLSHWARGVVVANGAPAERVHVNRLGVANRPGGWPAKAGPGLQPTATPLTVGFLGRAEVIKGLDDLVGALRYVPAAVPIGIRAVVVTSNEVERRFVRRLGSSVKDGRLTIEPPMSPRDVPGWLRSVDVLCCPSRAVEGGPTVALEAHAVGTPVIGSDLPALSEIVDPRTSGALYSAGDRRALAALLSDLAANPARIDAWRLALPAPRTFDRVVADYLALYAPRDS